MFDYLLKIASELNDGKSKIFFTKRIKKMAQDLASKDVLLIDINEMESIFNEDKVIITPSNESIEKIVLED